MDASPNPSGRRSRQLPARANLEHLRHDANHTALQVTVEHGGVELARVLLDAGADPNIRDDKYQATALGWAEYCGRPDIAELLQPRSAAT